MQRDIGQAVPKQSSPQIGAVKGPLTDDRVFVGGGSAAFTYGGRNILESMTIGGNGITYKVNAFNQRVSEAFSGNTTHYVHDIRGLIIAEANGSTGSTTKEYVWMEGELLAQIDSGGNIFYAHNSQVSLPQKMTNASRTVVWDQIIEPFGEVQSTPTSTTPTNHRFPGQYANSNNSLFYNNNRSYDPSLGFYVEADPIGQLGGLNQYGYAGQNPTQRIDFYGLVDLNLIAPGSEEYQMQQDYNDPRYFTVAAHGQGGRFAALNPMSVFGYNLITRGSYSVSGPFAPPCTARGERQDANRFGEIGSHIWLTI